MGLLGLGREVLTEFKADISDHKAKVKELEGAEKQLAITELEAAEARNEHLEGWIEKIGKVTLALVAVKEVGDIIWDGYKEGVKEARLETAAAGVDIERLSEAAGGLHTHMQLLEFAAKANKSAFKLTQEQMEDAEHAMRALERRGVPTAEAIDAVTTAVVTGRTKGLEPYGVIVDKHIKKLQEQGEESLTLAERTQVHTKAMEALKIVGEGVADSQDQVGESMQRTETKLTDSWSELKKALGQLVVVMQPFIEQLASAADSLSKIGDVKGGHGTLFNLANIVSFGQAQRNFGGRIAREINDSQAASDATLAGISMPSDDGGSATSNDVSPALQAALDRHLRQQLEQFKKTVKQVEAAQRKADEEYARSSQEALARLILHSAAGASNSNQVAGGRTSSLGAAADTSDGFHFGDPNYDIDQAMGRQRSQLAERDAEAGSRESRYAAFNAKQGEKLLEKTFGPVGEFELYKKGFDALTGAVGSMYDAIVSGQESASAAFKKFVGQSVAAVGKQMAIEAVKETAYALGNLAIGNMPGAAAHGLAAAEFAAGAVVAGVVAHELGYGGGTSARSGGGAGAPQSYGSSGGGSGGAGHSVTIVYADPFADDSPRMRQLKAQKLVNLALGTSSGKAA
jgi:hypothetical protein